MDALVKIYKSVFQGHGVTASSSSDDYSQVASLSQIHQTLAPVSKCSPLAAPAVAGAADPPDPSQGFKFDIDEIDTPSQPSILQRKATVATPISLLSSRSKLPGSTSTLATEIVSRTPAAHLSLAGRTPATEIVTRTPATLLVRNPSVKQQVSVGQKPLPQPPRASSNILTPKVVQEAHSLPPFNADDTNGVEEKSAQREAVDSGRTQVELVNRKNEEIGGVRVTEAPIAEAGGSKSPDDVNEVRKGQCKDGLGQEALSSDNIRIVEKTNQSVLTADLPETQVSQSLRACLEQEVSNEEARELPELATRACDNTNVAEETTRASTVANSCVEVEATLPLEDVELVEASVAEAPRNGVDTAAKKVECTIIDCTPFEDTGEPNTSQDGEVNSDAQDEEIPSSIPEEVETGGRPKTADKKSKTTVANSSQANSTATMEHAHTDDAVENTIESTSLAKQSDAIAENSVSGFDEPSSKDNDPRMKKRVVQAENSQSVPSSVPSSVPATVPASTLPPNPQRHQEHKQLQTFTNPKRKASAEPRVPQNKRSISSSGEVKTTISTKAEAAGSEEQIKARDANPTTLADEKPVATPAERPKFKFKEPVTVARRMGPGMCPARLVFNSLFDRIDCCFQDKTSPVAWH